MRKTYLIIVLLLAAGCSEPTSQEGLERGARELRRANWSAARTQLEKSIAMRPGSEQNLAAYNLLGIACWKLGKTQDAIEAFESARRLSPIATEPTYNLGVLLAESGDPAHALQALKEAALMDEKDPRPLEYMGSIYIKRKQWPEARRSFYAARSRAPASPRILTSIALIELETEKPETAAATLQGALAHDDSYAPALFNLGFIHHAHLHDDARARVYFQKFLSVTSAGPQADYARRVLDAAKMSGTVPPAPVADRSASNSIPPVRIPPASLPPQPPNYTAGSDLFAKAREAADRGRTDEAVAMCHQAAQRAAARNDKTTQEKALRLAIQLVVDSAPAHTELGSFHLAQGQNDSALKSFKAATALDDSYGPAFLGLGRAAIATREYDTALVSLKRAVAADPSNPESLWLLAQLYDKNIEQPTAAVKAYSDFAKLFSADSRTALARERTKVLSTARPVVTPANNAPVTRPPVAPVLALPVRTATPPVVVPERTPPPTLPSRSEPAEQNPDIASTIRVAATAPKNPDAARQAFARATDYQQRGDWNNAIPFLEQTVRNDATMDVAWFNLAHGYALRGETAKAKDAYLRTLEIKPDYTEARYNLAILYLESKDESSAEKMLLDLTQKKPAYANGWLALGQVYARSPGKISQAKAAYRKFLELAPTSRSAPGVRQWLMAQ